jgi:hypothetical protein
MRTTVRRPVTAGLAAALALAAPLLLTGCSLIPHPGGGHGVSLPGVSVGTGKLPKDWPSDVPVITGEIASGASVGSGDDKGHLWNASVKVSGAEAADEIATQLTGAGFQTGGSGGDANGAGAIYQKGDYTVLIAVARDGKDGWLANYTVTLGDGASEG